MVAALGVVFGDIGTSPIYTIQTVFNPADPHPVPVSHDNVLGVVSLILWSATLVVTVTYVLLALRVDNDGEGGIMALITLLRRWSSGGRARVVGVPRRARDLRCGPLPRRLDDHPRDLRAVGRRGARRPRPGARPVGRADHRGDPRRAVPRPALRHRHGGSFLRAGDDRVVRGRRGARTPRHRPGPRGSRRPLPDVRRRVPRGALPHRLLRPRRRGSRGHRRRGPLRRHGPLRSQVDLARVAARGLPCVRPQLPRARGRHPARPPDDLGAVLPPRPGLGPHPPGRAGHGSHRDRGPGGDHRRLLGRGPGRARGLPPPAADPAHVRRLARPDLRAVDQLAAASSPC